MSSTRATLRRQKLEAELESAKKLAELKRQEIALEREVERLSLAAEQAKVDELLEQHERSCSSGSELWSSAERQVGYSQYRASIARRPPALFGSGSVAGRSVSMQPAAATRDGDSSSSSSSSSSSESSSSTSCESCGPPRWLLAGDGEGVSRPAAVGGEVQGQLSQGQSDSSVQPQTGNVVVPQSNVITSSRQLSQQQQLEPYVQSKHLQG